MEIEYVDSFVEIERSNAFFYIPKIEKNTDPTNPMNGSNSGTAAATPPMIKIMPARNKIWDMLCLSFGMLGPRLRHKMSIGT